jgi:predicted lactoylglutathione lyase
MDQRISLVTLGVGDLAAARAFYARLGWRESPPSNKGVAFFQLPGMIFALWDRHALAEDSGVEPGDGFPSVTLAQNLPSKAAVDALLAEAEAAGARITKPAEDKFWGGYSGCFADPSGHIWEIAWNPFFPLAEDGTVRLPG